jgi:hypothetical protein
MEDASQPATSCRSPQEVIVHRSARIASAVAVAATLVAAPAALADSSYPDTTGVGLIHASMVQAQVADRAATASGAGGFQWADAGIGPAAGIGAALAAAGIAAGVRGRRRIVA